MAASILVQILKIYQVLHDFQNSKFHNSEKLWKINENSSARQNGSVKMIATAFRRDSDQHPGTKNRIRAGFGESCFTGLGENPKYSPRYIYIYIYI